MKFWPEVTRVVKPEAFTCSAEGGAGGGGGPDGPVVGPSGESGGVAPDSDAGEEVALGKSQKFIWLDKGDAPLVDHAGRDEVAADELAQPCGLLGVDFVIPGGHLLSKRRVYDRLTYRKRRNS